MKRSLIFVLLITLVLTLKAGSWKNMSWNGDTIFVHGGESFQLAAKVETTGTGQHYYPPQTMVLCPDCIGSQKDWCYDQSNMHCWGDAEKINDGEYKVIGGLLVDPWVEGGASESINTGRCGAFSGINYGPPKYIRKRADQKPDPCADRGDPINVQNGSYNISHIDISSPTRDGVKLKRTYMSRKRNLFLGHYNNYPTNLLRPYGDCGWTHNYAKYIVVQIDDNTDKLYLNFRDGNYLRVVW